MFGGRLNNLPNVKLKAAWLPLTAIAIQILLFTPSLPLENLPPSPKALAHLASYLFLAIFLLMNVRTAGIVVVGFGMLLNFIAISANGGYMPTTNETRRSAGFKPVPEEGGTVNNNVVGKNRRLLFLGDIFAIPEGFPLRNVFSVGDVIIGIGAVATIASAMGRGKSDGAIAHLPIERSSG